MIMDNKSGSVKDEEGEEDLLSFLFNKVVYICGFGEKEEKEGTHSCDDDDDDDSWQKLVANSVIFQFYEPLIHDHQHGSRAMTINNNNSLNYNNGQDDFFDQQSSLVLLNKLLANHLCIHNLFSFNRKALDTVVLHAQGNNLSNSEESDIFLRHSIKTPAILRRRSSSSLNNITENDDDEYNNNNNNNNSTTKKSGSPPTLTQSPPYNNSSNHHFSAVKHPYTRVFKHDPFGFDILFFCSSFSKDLKEELSFWDVRNALSYIVDFVKLSMTVKFEHFVYSARRNHSPSSSSSNDNDDENERIWKEIENHNEDFKTLEASEYIKSYLKHVIKDIVSSHLRSPRNLLWILRRKLFSILFILFSILYVTDETTKRFLFTKWHNFKNHINFQPLETRISKKDIRLLDCIIHFSIETYLGIDFLPILHGEEEVEIDEEDDDEEEEEGRRENQRVQFTTRKMLALEQYFVQINGSYKSYYPDDIMRPDHALLYERRRLLIKYLSTISGGGGRRGRSRTSAFNMYFGKGCINSDKDYFTFITKMWTRRSEDPIPIFEEMFKEKQEEEEEEEQKPTKSDNCQKHFSILSCESAKHDIEKFGIKNFWKNSELVLCVNIF